LNIYNLIKDSSYGLLFTLVIGATRVLAEPTSFDEQLRRILDQHPLIQSQEFTVSSRQNSARKSLAGYPDPEVMLARSHGGEDRVMVLNGPAADHRRIEGSEIQVTQPIPFPGKGLAQANMLDAATRGERIRLSQLRNRLAREFMTGLIQMRLLERQVHLVREANLRLKTLEGNIRLRYETGKSSLADLSMLRLRLSSSELAVQQAESEQRAIARSVEYFTKSVKDGERRSFASEEIDTFVADLEKRVLEKSSQIDGRSLDVLLSREEEAASSSGETLAKLQYLPDFQIFAGYSKENRPSLGYQEFMRQDVFRTGITIRVPLWSALTNHWEIADKSDQLKASRMKVEDARQKAAADLESSLARMEGIRKSLKIHRSELIPGAASAHDAAAIGYAAGKSDFASVTQSLDLHYEHQVNELRMQLDFDIELLKAAEMLNVIFLGAEDLRHE